MDQDLNSIESDDLSGEWCDAIETSNRLPALQHSNDMALLRYGFRVGGIGFLLAQEELGEVVTDFSVHPIPNTEKWFAGMINMRGNLVPVFDVKMLLGIEDGTGSKDRPMLLVLGQDEMAAGILVDELPMTVSLGQAEDKYAPLADVITKYVGEAFCDQGRIWIELDSEAFFRHIGEMASPGHYVQ